jgi:hypothetical protein
MSIKKYLERGYNYIHIGLVQIAVKPLYRRGIDSPVFLALRDATNIRYEQSLLAIVQTNLHNGPIYFNCAPDICKALKDPFLMNTLLLDLHMPKHLFVENSINYALVYRVYFKVMTTQMNPRCLVNFSPGETTLLQVDADQSACFVPKTLKWDQISIPRALTVPNPQPPRHLVQREASEIKERDDEVDIKFDFRSRSYSSSMNFMSRPHIEPIEASRFSTSSYQTVGRQPSKVGS